MHMKCLKEPVMNLCISYNLPSSEDTAYRMVNTFLVLNPMKWCDYLKVQQI